MKKTDKKRVMIKPGNDYEKIRVLSVCENKKPKSYNCTCLICGNNFTHSGQDILKYKNSGCPLCRERDRDAKKIESAKKRIGEEFGQLKIVGILDDFKFCSGRRFIFARCECLKCGKTTEIPINRLVDGRAKICKKCAEKNLNLGTEIIKISSVNGTNITSIDGRRTKNKNNSSGCTGVSWNESQKKWRAYINFQRKQYHLGVFSELESAISARKKAEKMLYGNFLHWYKNEYPEQWDKIQNSGNEHRLLCVENSDIFNKLSRNALTNKQKEVYDLLKFGMSVKDISAKLGCSTQNIYQIISSARKRNDKQKTKTKKQTKKIVMRPRIDWGLYANMDLSQLNGTEIKILLHVASGGKRRLIADDLGVSVSSVNSRLRRAMLKLNGEMDAYKKMMVERNKNEYKNNLEYRESRKKYAREYRKMNKSKRSEYMRKYRKTEKGRKYAREYIKKYYKNNPQVCYGIEKNITKKFNKFQVTIGVGGKRIFCSFDDLDGAKNFRNAVNSMREEETFWPWFQDEYPVLFGKIFDN